MEVQRLVRHLWLAPILAVALWLRLAGLGGERLYGDEAEYAIVARYLSRDLLYLAYPDITGMGAVPFVSQPPLILYLMAATMMVLGPTDLAAILPSALLGAATVAVVWFLGTRLGGRAAGATAAILVAVLPFHVEMSRRAMMDAGFVFFLMLTLLLLVRWMQTPTRGAALGAGAAAAATCLTKLPGVLVLPIVLVGFLVVLAITLLRRTDAATRKETLLQGALGAAPVAAGGLLYLGLIGYLEALGDLFLKLRWQMGRVDASKAVVQEIAAVPRDASFYFADPEFGFAANLGALVLTLGLIGLGIAVARFARRPADAKEHLVLPLAVLVLLGFFLYSDRKEGFYLLPFAPLAAVGVGYAIDGLRRLTAWGGLRVAPGLGRHAALALGLALVVAAIPAVGAARESIDDFALGGDVERYFGSGTDEAAAWIRENDPEAGQYGTLLGRWALHWYNEQPTYHWYIDHTYVDSQVESGKLKYVVYENYLDLAFDREYMRELIHKHDGKEVARFTHGWGQVQVFELNP